MPQAPTALTWAMAIPSSKAGGRATAFRTASAAHRLLMHEGRRGAGEAHGSRRGGPVSNNVGALRRHDRVKELMPDRPGAAERADALPGDRAPDGPTPMGLWRSEAGHRARRITVAGETGVLAAAARCLQLQTPRR